ncbi:hypothetical protein COLO4_13794 [Corchorus olitorius]|uniref:Uncharacterized protein n=1 Tax=Corchorus olitorius TaxID=93759 RepID=A0A1R3JUU0_9ROSI|nr:hypothetical protein COLO4_13794 [Corchorus olitorius]
MNTSSVEIFNLQPHGPSIRSASLAQGEKPKFCFYGTNKISKPLSFCA